MSVMILLLAVIWLAYSNGANDNYKGVATLFGTGTTDYRSTPKWDALCRVRFDHSWPR